MAIISLTAIYHITRYITYILSIFVLVLIYSVNALAKNNCDVNASLVNPAILTNSGIGGTGAIAFDSGIGGTGVQAGGTGIKPLARRDSGIGGTGVIASDSGIGGTGVHDGGIGGTGNVERGGIGGTGNMAQDSGIGGTGIVGTITGFASVCVNGVEIHYDPSTPISVDGRSSTLRDLAVGQIIAAHAVGTDREFTARNIAIIHATVGPISSFNSETRQMYVLGQTIQIGQSKELEHLSSLRAGDWVQVSGHRLPGGIVMASRIESIAPHSEAKLNGYVTRVDADGFEVNGTRIHHDPKLLPIAIKPGMEVQVAGHWDGAYLKAQHVQAEPTLQSIGNVEKIVFEGYIHAFDGKELTVNNRVITLDSNTQLTSHAKDEFRLGQRIQVSGRLAPDQRIIAEHIDSRQELSIQIQERMDRSQIDNSGKDKKDHSGTESEHKNTKGLGQDNSGKGHGGRDDLKKEIETKSDSGKDHSQGGDSHSKDSSGSSRDEKRSDHSDASGNSTDKSHDSHQQSDKVEKLNDRLEKSGESNVREGSGSEQSGRQDKHSDHPQIDNLSDRPERPGEFDSRDASSNDVRDSVRDTIDIPDRVRDHGHHDRPIHDRTIDR